LALREYNGGFGSTILLNYFRFIEGAVVTAS